MLSTKSSVIVYHVLPSVDTYIAWIYDELSFATTILVISFVLPRSIVLLYELAPLFALAPSAVYTVIAGAFGAKTWM